MTSASWIVDSRCAIIRLVLFFISLTIASCICFSVLVSTLDVASSNISILGCARNALAMDRSCLCPCDIFSPSDISLVSYLSGSFLIILSQLLIRAASYICSSVASLLEYLRLFFTLSAKSTVSWSTIAVFFLRLSQSISLILTSSISIRPLSTS